jgi:AcrR family transcriptional regulator
MSDVPGLGVDPAIDSPTEPEQPLARAGRLSSDDRRNHLLDVAAHILRTQGLGAVTMERVAETAGVSKGLGYAYFDNSKDVLEALRVREIDRLIGRAAQAIVEAGPAYEARIRAALHAFISSILESAGLFRALLGADVGRVVADDDRLPLWPAVVEYYAELARDEYDLDLDQAEIAASVFLSGLASIADRVVRRPDRRSEIEDTYIRMILGGLAALGRDSGGDRSAVGGS